MNSNQIVEVLKEIESVFPLPTESEFCGKHHLVLENDKLIMGVWCNTNEGVKCFTIAFDNEEITKAELEKISQEIKVYNEQNKSISE